jgi:shikimate kinase
MTDLKGKHPMRVFIAGVGCVGKTTIAEKLAALLGYPFFDLDAEIESYFGTSIERLRSRFLTTYSYRKEASKALEQLVSRDESRNCVIALPPSGLMDAYWRIVKKANATIVVIEDSPENIVKRISFYDIDSKPIEKELSEKERKLYLQEIRGDISYFKPTYRRANVTVAINGLGVEEAAQKIKDLLINSVPRAPEPCASQRTGSRFAFASR